MDFEPFSGILNDGVSIWQVVTKLTPEYPNLPEPDEDWIVEAWIKASDDRGYSFTIDYQRDRGFVSYDMAVSGLRLMLMKMVQALMAPLIQFGNTIAPSEMIVVRRVKS